MRRHGLTSLLHTSLSCLFVQEIFDEYDRQFNIISDEESETAAKEPTSSSVGMEDCNVFVQPLCFSREGANNIEKAMQSALLQVVGKPQNEVIHVDMGGQLDKLGLGKYWDDKALLILVHISSVRCLFAVVASHECNQRACLQDPYPQKARRDKSYCLCRIEKVSLACVYFLFCGNFASGFCRIIVQRL